MAGAPVRSKVAYEMKRKDFARESPTYATRRSSSKADMSLPAEESADAEGHSPSFIRTQSTAGHSRPFALCIVQRVIASAWSVVMAISCSMASAALLDPTRAANAAISSKVRESSASLRSVVPLRARWEECIALREEWSASAQRWTRAPSCRVPSLQSNRLNVPTARDSDASCKEPIPHCFKFWHPTELGRNCPRSWLAAWVSAPRISLSASSPPHVCRALAGAPPECSVHSPTFKGRSGMAMALASGIS
eukprot:scaffold168003_cov33-Tisochrysis_lutea.AAC.3